MKKSVFLILVFVFFLTGLSVAQPPDVIIGDFEQTITNELFEEDPNIMDLWTFYEFRGVSSQFVISSSTTTGVTLGNQSLRVEYPPIGNAPDKDGGTYTCEPLELDIGRIKDDFSEDDFNEVNEAFWTHTNITMDITFDPADWTPENTADPITVQVNISVNTQNGTRNGGYDYSPPDIDTGNLDHPGAWNPVDFPEVHTRTLSWGILNEKAHIPNEDPGDWFEIILNIKTLNCAGKGVIYLDNIRFNTLVDASSPKPAFNEQNVDTLPTLSFVAGSLATSHTLYFGTDAAEVNEATTDVHPNVTVVEDLNVSTYTLTELLDFYTTYYWRVDETDGQQVWPGAVWKFVAGGFEMLDNFESYPTTNTARDDSRIFVTWRDGKRYTNADGVKVPGNGTNMIVGTNSRPETVNVYNGFQSLSLTYDNTSKTPYVAETDRTYESPMNFATAHDGQAFESLDMQIHGRFPMVNGFTDNGNGQYTVIGSGKDILAKADEFHFAYQPQELGGNGSITAKIESVEDKSQWSKGGVMIRDTLDADAAYAAVISLPDGDIVYQHRETKGGDTTNTRPENHTFTLPYWVRISKNSSDFTAWMSADGQQWEQIGEPNYISMFNYVVCGLAVTSHVDAGTPCTAVFSNVSLEGTESAIVQSVDIGLALNDPANIYVTLEDDNSQSATVNYEDDPNGTLVDYWGHWLLFSTPLTDFTVDNSAIDLTQIKKIVIGIGDGTRGGEGTLYVDDVRLTLPANQ